MNSVHAVSNGSDFAKDLRFIFFFAGITTRQSVPWVPSITEPVEAQIELLTAT